MRKRQRFLEYLIIFWLCFTIIVVILVRGKVVIGDSDIVAFIGSIIGGIIALIGVYYTINSSFDALELSLKKQENDKFKEMIGEKLNRLYKVKGIIFRADRILSNRRYGWNENLEKDDSKKINDSFFNFFFPTLIPMLENAAAVDWEFYDEIKKFVDETRTYIFDMKNESLDRLTNSIDELTKRIEEHEQRLSRKFKEVSTSK